MCFKVNFLNSTSNSPLVWTDFKLSENVNTLLWRLGLVKYGFRKYIDAYCCILFLLYGNEEKYS